MQQNQREMFSKGLIDVANISLGALVFGQFVSGKVVEIGLVVLGILFWLVIYIGAFSMSLDRNKPNRGSRRYQGKIFGKEDSDEITGGRQARLHLKK